jgi:serine/threonine-protein kinase
MSDSLDRLKAALVDRYRIDWEVGSGGMATVYLAEDLRHHRPVAVKVMRPELAATIGPDRFLREIEIAAQLHHPHILPLFDSGDADGFLFYVMPYEDGQSLRERLQREGELPVGDVVRLLADVVEALSHAHLQGVVHRDIKPENILLSGHHALVTDFGVAKAVSEATGRESLTTAGMALGTPTYMAPEQAAADPNIDYRADLYAVGATAYEMLTGEPPFHGSPQTVLVQHVTDEPVPITERRQTIPPPLARLVMQCLAKKPADRPQSAEDMLPVLQGLATPSSGTQPIAAPPARRLTKPWFFAGAAVAVIAAALIFFRPSAPERVPATNDRSAIAVLPFQNLSADPARAYFASGLHDELLTQLAKVSALRVISRTSVMGYERSGKPATEVAAELGVETIVEGSVQTEGDRLRVNVQLIDGATDQHLWAERYDRTLDDVFAV